MDAFDGLGQQPGDTEGSDPRPAGLGHAVRADELLDGLCLLQALLAKFSQHSMAHGRAHTARPFFFQQIGRGGDSAGGFGKVIHDEHIFALYFPDKRMRFHHRGRNTTLGDDGQRAVQRAGIRITHLDATHIRRNHHRIRPAQPLATQILQQNRRRIQMIHRNVEKPLNLRRMQIHRQHPVHSGRRQ